MSTHQVRALKNSYKVKRMEETGLNPGVAKTGRAFGPRGFVGPYYTAVEQVNILSFSFIPNCRKGGVGAGTTDVSAAVWLGPMSDGTLADRA